jgi:hypothetical protein
MAGFYLQQLTFIPSAAGTEIINLVNAAVK